MDEFDKFFIGLTLRERWKVLDRHEVIREAPSACRTYRGTGPGESSVFIKVLVPEAETTLEARRRQIDEFLYETSVVAKCGERNMRRVVRALASDALTIPGIVPIEVHYLVFEWADRDLRSFEASNDEEHLAATLRFLHQMATALHELHFSQIVHQNLNPAAVLHFGSQSSKLGGFSHAHSLDRPRPYGAAPYEQTYAPPEILYGNPVSSFDDRCAVDMYHLGCLGFYMLVNAGATTLLERRLPTIHHWSTWSGSYSDVLPYLRVAHESIVRDIEPNIHDMVRADLARALAQLTDPDPTRRGHPKNLGDEGMHFGFERYISLFIRLARKVELRLLKRAS